MYIKEDMKRWLIGWHPWCLGHEGVASQPHRHTAPLTGCLLVQVIEYIYRSQNMIKEHR